jgi:hypothetical protein
MHGGIRSSKNAGKKPDNDEVAHGNIAMHQTTFIVQKIEFYERSAIISQYG